MTTRSRIPSAELDAAADPERIMREGSLRPSEAGPGEHTMDRDPTTNVVSPGVSAPLPSDVKRNFAQALFDADSDSDLGDENTTDLHN